MAKKLKYPMTKEFESAFDRFMGGCYALIEKEDAKYVLGNPSSLDYDLGKRYVKLILVSGNGSSRSAYCFIDKPTGDIYKAASWLAPAKGARGNIYASDGGVSAMTPYGAKYLKGGKF